MIKFREEDIKYLAVTLPYEVQYYKYDGNFYGVIAAASKLLEGELPHALRMRLLIEREVAEVLKSDYLMRFDDLLEAIREEFPACTADNLREIVRMGQADYIHKGMYGFLYFQQSAPANILSCHREYLMRLTDPDAREEHPLDELRLHNIKIMRERGSRAFRFTVEQELSVSPDAERSGERIRVHLPYPAACGTQPGEEIRLISCSHDGVFISDSASRTACIETAHRPGDRYVIRFSYVNRAVYANPEPSAVLDDQPDFFTGELYPHIRFTPLINELAREIAGEEKNPLLLARRVYDWVTKNVRYSYMREYLCIENIPEFAIINRRGDCGVMALTFITLCRRLGIPAKWESGSSVRPGAIGSHDWAMFYVAPYGWLYTDASYGSGAYQRGNTELWNHYFCNLDPYRLVANTEFQQRFDPPKDFMRMDPYDNQSGEAEFESHGLGFGETVRRRRVISAQEI